MSKWEDDVTDKDLAWHRIAQAKGLGCKVCGEPNPDRGQTWWNDLCPAHQGANEYGMG